MLASERAGGSLEGETMVQTPFAEKVYVVFMKTPEDEPPMRTYSLSLASHAALAPATPVGIEALISVHLGSVVDEAELGLLIGGVEIDEPRAAEAAASWSSAKSAEPPVEVADEGSGGVWSAAGPGRFAAAA